MTLFSSFSPPRRKLLEVTFLLSATALGIWVLFWITSFLLHRAPEPIGSRADLFTEGARMTLLLTLTSGILGIVVGVLAGIGKLSANRLLRLPVDFFVWLIRGTPLLVQILFVYYALPSILPSLRLSEFTAAMIALALNVGAYNAEVIRAGILAVARGQNEAARSLGLSKYKTMRWVVLPQALQIVIPPLVNNIIALLKDSSLASAIGLLELSLAGNRISSETFLPVPVLTTVAAIYLILTTVLTAVTVLVERILKKI